MSDIISDDAIILNIKPYQTADKYVECFTREHGKVRFIAYGARYPKNLSGRLLQAFFEVHLEIQQGTRIDKLRTAELVQLPQGLDMRQMAYAAVVTELVSVFTEDREPQEELYELLQQTLLLITQRNPRLVTLAFGIKLLQMVGLAPQVEACVSCGTVLEQDAESWFSPLQGGAVCCECHLLHPDGGYEHCGCGTRQLWRSLLFLDMQKPERFTVRGAELMELEKMLYKFVLFQTDRELNSLKFLAQLGQ